MRWYLNDVSLQGQFRDTSAFETVLGGLVATRARVAALRQELRTTRTLSDRPVGPGMTVRHVMQQSRDHDLRRAILIWLDRTGPFIEDDRTKEEDDYFEYKEMDVTESGLGEAARVIKAGASACTFSFRGGAIDFAASPLSVHHGLVEDRLGTYDVENVWTIEDLASRAIIDGPPIASWRSLIEAARERFPRLMIPDSIYQSAALAREPFEASIRDRVLELLGHLDAYMMARGPDGAEWAAAREIVQKFFVGDRALFTGESEGNRQAFRAVLTFPDPENPRDKIFAHWHGKISHRYFRLHFEWPVPAGARRLKIVYLGPKLTKG